MKLERWSTEKPEKLDKPLHWRKPRRVTVTQDLFHEDTPPAYVAAVFGVMAACPQHIFQVLTKRPERAHVWFEWVSRDAPPASQAQRCFESACRRRVCYEMSRFLNDYDEAKKATKVSERGRWPLPNVWIGVSAENQETYDARLPSLMQIPAAVRWVSAEPLLGPIDLRLNLSKPDWVVVGGESGPGARRCNVRWIYSIIEQCRQSDVPVFVKQLGSKATETFSVFPPFPPGLLKHPKGGNPDEWPEELRVREYPQGGAS